MGRGARRTAERDEGRAGGRILFASGGNANLIDAHRHWAAGEHMPYETSLTFSGQVASFVREIGAEALMISANPDGRRFADDRFRIEHRPKRTGSGLRYYLAELRNALALARAGRRFRATLAIIDSGAVPFFMMPLFRLFGMRLVVVLHNTIWPHGFRPASRGGRLVEGLDAALFRWWADAAIAVSPEAERQVAELAPRRHRCPVVPVRAQFERGYFEAIPPAPDWGEPHFRIMFIGRVIRAKGVFDILEMARLVEARLPGRVRWTICGRGPDLAELEHQAAALGGVVEIKGWTSLDELQRVYARTHAAIVPTTSGFAEGLAMTAVEAILAGRPIVTNPVVPAHEVLAPAALLGRTNDPASHAEAVIAMASDRALYERLRDACPPLRAPFYDREQGLAAVLGRVTRGLAAR